MYPINLFLDDKPCLVIGGGTVAAGKIKGLLAAHGNVTVIAPHFCRAVLSYGTHAQVTLKERPYEKGDEEGYFLVLCCSDDSAVNERAAKEALSRKQLVNVCDCPSQSNWATPSVIRRGDLLLTISTNGKSPALSRKIRQRLEKEFPSEYGEQLNGLGELRNEAMSRLTTPQERQTFWRGALTNQIMEYIETHRIQEALHLLHEELDVFFKERKK